VGSMRGSKFVALAVGAALALAACSSSTDPSAPSSPSHSHSETEEDTGAGAEPGSTPETPSAPTSPVALSVESSEPETPDAPQVEPPLEAWATVDTLTVTSWGSSSCPYIAEIASVDESDEVVELELSTDPDGPCTADMAPTTVDIPVDVDLRGFTVRASIVF
jgi:hypothetical protein